MNRPVRLPRRRVLRALGGACAAVALPVSAQTGPWSPTRPLTIVVPYPAGGPTDVLARAVGAELARSLGQPVVVENVAGAAGALGTRRVAQAAPDGHALVLGTNQTHATNVSLLPQGGGYDPIRDFAPVAGLVDLQHVVVVGPDVPVRTAAELVALAKRDPGKLTAGSTGPGSASHLALELFKARTGTDIAHVPYKGSAPLLTDLLGGHVNLSFATVPTVLAQLQAGRLRAIAVASPTRSPYLPEVPTLAEAGVRGVEADAWLALFAPAGVPPAALARLRAATLDAMRQEAVRAVVQKQGMTPNSRDGEAFATFVKEDVSRWAEVVRVGNVKAE
ncbi:MAG TPA: tripartite tricarboxylate transporter substrate binding protein [Burkholderiaceae bacterium]|nr:tripartite tricarboxylate transporter substrate binding protein [Burkholderiaceae bacterium]